MQRVTEQTGKLFTAICAIVLMLTLTQCKPNQTFPNGGFWYCADLQIQMCLDWDQEMYDTHAIINGEKINCAVSTDYGNRFFSIGCEDVVDGQWDYDTIFYSGEFISFNDKVIVTRDAQTQTEYVFVRVFEDPSEASITN